MGKLALPIASWEQDLSHFPGIQTKCGLFFLTSADPLYSEQSRGECLLPSAPNNEAQSSGAGRASAYLFPARLPSVHQTTAGTSGPSSPWPEGQEQGPMLHVMDFFLC
jgi:hypothetical protein